MCTLLHLDSSPLETSFSRELAQEFVKTWKEGHENGKVIYRDLAESAPKPLDAAWISAADAPPGARTEEQNRLLEHSDELISELEEANDYVISVAMHNIDFAALGGPDCAGRANLYIHAGGSGGSAQREAGDDRGGEWRGVRVGHSGRRVQFCRTVSESGVWISGGHGS